MNCKKAREIPIDQVALLLGIALGKRKNNEIWCASPFRKEKTPSFKLNLSLNTWVDFGDSDFSGCENKKVVSGDGITLVKRVKNCSTSEALAYISSLSLSTQIPVIIHSVEKNNSSKKPNNILKIRTIKNQSLIAYAAKRRISKSILIRFCKEVHYFKYKQRIGIGFLNESGGWEINSESVGENFKRCFGRKDITLINEGKQKIWVTEGFFDFLSLLTLRYEFDISNDSFLILNGVGMAERALQFLRNYEKVNLLLDNDDAGTEVKEYLISNLKLAEDFSYRYQDFNDLNAYLMAKTT